MSSEEEADSVGMENGGKGLLSSKAKMKRVRQRVDAGEPRNSYASIPNFSSRPPAQASLSPMSAAYHSNGFACKMLQNMYEEKMHPLMMLEGVERSAGAAMNGSSANPSRLYLNGGSGPACDLSALYGRASVVGMSPDSSPTPERSSSNGSVASTNSHLLRDILQQGRKFNGGAGDSPPAHVPPVAASKGGPSAVTSAGHGPTETQGGAEEEAAQESADQSAAGSRTERPDPIREDSSVESRANCNMMRMMSAEPSALSSPPAAATAATAAAASPAGVSTTVEPAASPASSPSRSCCSPRSAAATPNWQSSAAGGNGNAPNDLEVKRARVETIVNNMLQGPVRSQGSCSGFLGEQQNPVNGCKKRKLYQPQQHETSSRTATMNGEVDAYEEEEEDEFPEPLSKRRSTDMVIFRQQLRQMQEQLVAMQQHYIEMMDAEEEENRSPRPLNQTNNNNSGQRSPDNSDYEDKPCISEMNKESRLDGNQQQDYDNASMYDDHRRLVIDQDKLSGSSRHEQSASEEGGIKEIRKSCIVQPSNYGGSNLDYEWLAESLKAELSTSLSQIVDTVMSRCVSQRKLVPSSSKLETDPEPPTKDPTLLSQMLDRKSPRTTKVIDRGARVNGIGGGLRASPYPQDITASAPKPSPFFFPFKPPTSIAAATAAFLYGSPPQMPPLSLSQPFTSSPIHSTSTPQSLSLEMPEQTEPVSLVVAPKKKRHKVTDTRLNPRGPLQLTPLRGNGLSQDSQDISPKYSSMLGSLASDNLGPQHNLFSHHPPPPPLVPVSLPTTVAIPNPSLNQSDLFHGFTYDPHRMPPYNSVDPEEDSSTPSSIHHPLLPSHGHLHQRGSPDSLHYSHMKQEGGDLSDPSDSPAAYDSSMPMTSTLTPMHLRKAKLMFFYARYPSSAVLKMYFPDIKFNKNNTAQLVKWFSNFREFYYIQMEKYARQAMSEGVKVSEDLKVTPDSELLRVLNLHYNRNNHIEAPENFRYVVEQTLREFFKALVAGKDSEQSWKKSIYKVIARLDDNVPEYFKSPNFLETLE